MWNNTCYILLWRSGGQILSYDISLYRKGIKNAERIYYDYDGNITYNVCEMLEVAFGEQHLKKWNDKPVNEFIEEFKKGYEDMMLNPTKYKKYDSPNGWGTYETTLKAIQNLYNYIVEYTNYDGLENVYLEFV